MEVEIRIAATFKEGPHGAFLLILMSRNHTVKLACNNETLHIRKDTMTPM
jgi:hypothetical protein